MVTLVAAAVELVPVKNGFVVVVICIQCLHF